MAQAAQLSAQGAASARAAEESAAAELALAEAEERARAEVEAAKREAVALRQEAADANTRRDKAEAAQEAAEAERTRERLRREELEMALDQLTDTHSSEMTALRAEAAGAQRREAEIGAAERAAAQEELAAARQAAATAKSELDMTLQLLEAREKAQSEALQLERERADAAEEQLAAASGRLDEAEEERRNLDAQVQAFAEVNDRMQNELAEAREAARKAEARTANLAEQVSTVETAIGVLRGERAAAESALKQKAEKALEEYAVVLRERDELRISLQEAMSKCASALGVKDRLESECKSLREANDALGRSKALLQRTMVEQLSAVRTQLDHAQVQNRELDVAVTRQRENTERLQSLVESERRSNKRLLEQEALAAVRMLADGTPMRVPPSPAGPAAYPPRPPSVREYHAPGVASPEPSPDHGVPPAPHQQTLQEIALMSPETLATPAAPPF